MPKNMAGVSWLSVVLVAEAIWEDKFTELEGSRNNTMSTLEKKYFAALLVVMATPHPYGIEDI